MPASLTAVARHFLFVRETEGPNHGYWVSYFLRYTGNVEGESWCAAFTSKICDIAYKGKSPLTRSAGTRVHLAQARDEGWVVTKPQKDDLFFYVRQDGVPHHTGIVTALEPLTGIAGNTSADGRSSNGDGVYEHEIGVAKPGKIVFVRLPSKA